VRLEPRCTALAAPRARSIPKYNRPETIEETAELVQHAGGQDIAVPVDHLDLEQVQRW